MTPPMTGPVWTPTLSFRSPASRNMDAISGTTATNPRAKRDSTSTWFGAGTLATAQEDGESGVTRGTSGPPLNINIMRLTAPCFLYPARTIGRNEVDAPDGLDLQRPLVLCDEVVEVQEHAVQHAQLGLGRQQQELLALKNCARETGPTWDQ